MSFLQSAPFEIKQMIFNELLKNDIEMQYMAINENISLFWKYKIFPRLIHDIDVCDQLIHIDYCQKITNLANLLWEKIIDDNNIVVFKELFSSYIESPDFDVLDRAIYLGHLEMVNEIIKSDLYEYDFYDIAENICLAIQYGHLEITKLLFVLFDCVNEDVDKIYMMIYAAQYNQMTILKWIFSQINN
jgi:hypothetical protein